MPGAVGQPPQTQPAHQRIDHGGSAAVLQGKQHRLQKNGLSPAQRLRPALHRAPEHPFLRQRSQQADPEKPYRAAGRHGQQHRQHLARQQIPHRPAKGRKQCGGAGVQLVHGRSPPAMVRSRL